MLYYIDLKKDCQLTTDASSYAFGAILFQEDKPIVVLYRTVTTTEEGYAPNEKEMLDMIWALSSLRNFRLTFLKISYFSKLMTYQPTSLKLFFQDITLHCKRTRVTT